MKKKLLVFALALSMCSVPVYAEEEVTAESVLQGMEDYSASASSEAGSVTFNLDAALNVSSEDAPETSVPITMTGSFDVKMIQNPLLMSMNGSMSFSLLGTSEDSSMEMYLSMTEDGQADTYVKATAGEEESGWQHTTMAMDDVLDSMGVSSLEELNTMSMDDLFGTDLEWTLTEADDTYTLEAQLPFSDMMPLVEASMDAAGESAQLTDEEMEMVTSLLDSFVMNMSYVVDKETYAPQSAHVDFNDSSLTAVNQLIEAALASSSEDGSTSTVTIALNDFSIDMTYSGDTVESIEIPEEALNTEAVSAEDLAEDAASLAEDATEAAE